MLARVHDALVQSECVLLRLLAPCVNCLQRVPCVWLLLLASVGETVALGTARTASQASACCGELWLHLQRTAPLRPLLLPPLRVWMPGFPHCVRGAMVWWVFALCLNEVLQLSCGVLASLAHEHEYS